MRTLLIKWIVALLVPVAIFTFVWSGEAIINNALLSLLGTGSLTPSISLFIQLAVFIVIFYATTIALAGYLVAADSGQRGMIDLWTDIAVYVLVPLFLVISEGLITDDDTVAAYGLLLLRERGLGAVRVGTVDDYQGQEERIILISTARLFIVNVILVSSPVFQMNSRKLACSK